MPPAPHHRAPDRGALPSPGPFARAISSSRAVATATRTSRSSRSSRTRPRRASCAVLRRAWPGPRPRSARRPGRGPDDRRDDPRLRDGAPARGPQHLRRGGSGRRRHHAPRVPARLPDRAGRTGPARRRHPDDRRLAARDDPGGRGDGRRDRRVRRAGRSERRPDDPHVTDDRPDLPGALALGARPADLRTRAGELPALRRRDADPCARQHRDGLDRRRRGAH